MEICSGGGARIRAKTDHYSHQTHEKTHNNFIQLKNLKCANRLTDENDVSVGIARFKILSLVRL